MWTNRLFHNNTLLLSPVPQDSYKKQKSVELHAHVLIGGPEKTLIQV